MGDLAKHGASRGACPRAFVAPGDFDVPLLRPSPYNVVSLVLPWPSGQEELGR